MQPPQQPQPPTAPPPQQAWPQQPYPYQQPYPPPKKDDTGKTIAIVVVVIVVVIVLVIAVAAVAFMLLAAPLIPNKPQFRVVVSSDNENWTVTVFSTPTGLQPTSTDLTIRDSVGLALLTRTHFSALTLANWPTYHAVYADNNPVFTEIYIGDQLEIDQTQYPSGSRIEIANAAGTLVITTLQ